MLFMIVYVDILLKCNLLAISQFATVTTNQRIRPSTSIPASCTGYDWERINFLHSSPDGAVAWICDSVNTAMF